MFFDREFVSMETDYKRGRLRSDFALANKPRASMARSVVLRSTVLVGIVLLAVTSLVWSGQPQADIPAITPTDAPLVFLPGPSRVR